jgi:hypothetical protein
MQFDKILKFLKYFRVICYNTKNHPFRNEKHERMNYKGRECDSTTSIYSVHDGLHSCANIDGLIQVVHNFAL